MWSNMWSRRFFDHLGLRGKCLHRRRIKGLRSRYFPARRRSDPLPNQARYQLRYTRIFNFCHYTTAREKIKDFSVCGHSCGQSRFYAAFSNRRKSNKRRCRKALCRFASPYPGYRHGAPKAGALPTSLHPDKPALCHLAGCGRGEMLRPAFPAAYFRGKMIITHFFRLDNSYFFA